MLNRNAKDRNAAVDSTPKGSAVPSQSVIGRGFVVTGDCVTDGHIRIQGTVAGSVTANGLELGEGGVIDGDVSVPQGGKKGQVFVVAGRVTGRVKAPIVDVKKSGVVLGGIDAQEVTIHGSVEGGVQVRSRLTVSSTAVVSGDVKTDRLVMEEGGRVNGTIQMGRASAASKPSLESSGADEVDEPSSERGRAVA
ncbi:MAG: polymer-forming cytoskeletal protein [Gemmatimonadota bacterium]